MGTRWIGPILAFSVVTSAAVPAADLGSEAQRANGKELYDVHCAQCHGETGDGVGHATSRVKPQPRDFTSGKYKFRATASGLLPTDEDLRRVIRVGLPYTSMPGWPNFTDGEVQNIIYYLKTFSADFENDEKYGPPLQIGDAPPSTPESIARGREVYDAQGCAACHGTVGRGDGRSAPTLSDDWGKHLRPADMTMRWTFRGGPTKTDVFRTFSTGLNGTPMPSYGETLAVEDRWHLVNYIDSLGSSDEPGYSNLLLVEYVEDEIDLAATGEIFDAAPLARFPLVGQIMEPGRNFYPATTSVTVQAVRNRREIAFRVRWHDMRAEPGSNSPLLEVPPWDEDNPDAASSEASGEDDPWGGEAEDDPWGGEAVEDDPWGGEELAEEDFWGEEDDAGDSGAEGFSDAVALQFPSQIPSGIRKPYFLFGDTESPVDLWFVDLARGMVEQFVGRGSDNLSPSQNDDIEVVKTFDEGRWTVVFKRSLRSTSNITFAEDRYIPIAFSVWDGFNRERGNKRALSSWFYLYVSPVEKVSPMGPMLQAAVGTLFVELVIIFFLRRRYQNGASAVATASGPPVPATK